MAAARAGVTRFALGRLVRDAWWAASAPTSFFDALRDVPHARVGRAALAALLSGLIAAAAAALAFVRATDSDGYLLAWGLLTAIGLPYLAMIAFVGGLVMVRSGQLDLRAWEIAAWSWVPAGVLALSLLPAALVAPVPAALAGLAAFPVWNVVVVVHGVRVLSPARLGPPVALYLVAVFVVPALLTVVSYALMRGMQAAP